MKSASLRSPGLTASVLTVALGTPSAIGAEPIGLSFQLQPPPVPIAPPLLAPELPPPPPVTAAPPLIAPLPVPPRAGHPPIASPASQTFAALPPPPPLPAPILPEIPATLPPDAIATVPRVPVAPAVTEAEKNALPEPEDAIAPDSQDIGLAFELAAIALPEPSVTKRPVPKAQLVVATQAIASTMDAAAREAYLFAGGSDSIVAKAVGHAEGTRTQTGDRTSAYYGHVDPGNGVWNLGSFSYQHGARSPEAADELQLKRLKTQNRVLQAKAVNLGLSLSLEEELNGLDLANQAPMAALGRQGYLDWLAQSRHLGMAGQEAVLWARTRSFLDPDTQRWNAPGLGNNIYWISHDQERRMLAIARVLEYAPFPTPVYPVTVAAERAIAAQPEGELTAKVSDIGLSFLVATQTTAPVQQDQEAVQQSDVLNKAAIADLILGFDAMHFDPIQASRS